MKIAHLSDLHFSRSTSRSLLVSLADDIEKTAPDVIAVSGDITDRGRNYQYREALEYLETLGRDVVMTPGNREVCASTFWEWMIPSLSMRRYRTYCGMSDRIVYRSEKHRLLMIGLNSVHFFPSWPGKVSRDSRYWFRSMASDCADYFKVLVLHHPVAPVIRGSSFWAHQLSDAAAILRICFEHGVRLILQGHKHRSSFLELREPESASSVIVSACGAPVMNRGDRIYHLIEIDNGVISARPREYVNDRFIEKASYTFETVAKR